MSEESVSRCVNVDQDTGKCNRLKGETCHESRPDRCWFYSEDGKKTTRFEKIEAAQEAIYAAKDELAKAIKDEMPLGMHVRWNHGDQLRHGDVVDHGSDSVLVQGQCSEYWVSAWSITEAARKLAKT